MTDGVAEGRTESMTAGVADGMTDGVAAAPAPVETPEAATDLRDEKTENDPFDEIDYGEYFNDYLDPGFKSPASETVEKPSFETFLSSPVTLSDHLHSQLALVALSEAVRDAAEGILGNLDGNGYLMSTVEEMAVSAGHTMEEGNEALRVGHTLEPPAVGDTDSR